MGKVQDKKKEQHWRRLLHEQKASGKSVAVFCGERRIPVHQFYWWQRTLRERADQGRAQRPPDEAHFIPVRLPLFSAAPIEVVHPAGCVVRVPVGFDPMSLRRVLETLDPSSSPSAET
jgi:hypothetical protein